MNARGLYPRIQWRRNADVWGIFVAAFLLLAVYAFLFPALFQMSGLARLSQTWFPLAAAAMAQALIMLTGGVDLSIGPAVSVGCVLTVAWVGDSPGAMALGVVGVLAVGALMGAGAGLIVNLLRLPPIIVTLAMSFVWTGVALLILPIPGGSVPEALSDALAGDYPTPILILVALVLLWKLWTLTPIGLASAAFGGNPAGAFRSGVDIDRARVAAYAIAGALCALAGLFLAAQAGAGDPTIGAPYTLNSITAAVLGAVAFSGGLGTMRGALAGALLLTAMVSVMFLLGVSAFYQYIAQGLVILAAVSAPLLRRKIGL
jgi:ribose transport system permease protein